MSTIIGIKLSERENCSEKFQEIISAYGCYIQARVGLHNIENNLCAEAGIIILQVLDVKEIINDMLKELKSIKNIQVKTIRFTEN